MADMQLKLKVGQLYGDILWPAGSVVMIEPNLGNYMVGMKTATITTDPVSPPPERYDPPPPLFSKEAVKDIKDALAKS
jgi:hypothetical protein